MNRGKKSLYEIYQTQSSEALRDALYAKILQKAIKFDVSMFQNPELAKALCDGSRVAKKIKKESSQAVVDTVIWLLQTRKSAQLSD
jgi:flagellar biosynthesis protein FlhB